MKKRLITEKLVIFILILMISIQSLDTFYSGSQDHNIFYSQASNPNIVLAGAKDITIPTEDEILAGKTELEIFNYFLQNQKYIMHAGGTIGKDYYTNSYEAIKQNYKQGNRIFEIDLNFTSDNHLVLVHGWTEYDYLNRIGLPYNANKPVMSLTEFKNTKIKGKYTTMSIYDLINFMKEHKYSYFILNLKGGANEKVTTKALKQLVKAAKNDSKILNRFVIWGYNSKVVKAIKNVYDFKLIALNVKNYSKMTKGLNTTEEIINYCKKNKISIILFQYNDYKQELINAAKQNKISTFMYTVDSATFVTPYFNKGVTMAFTNKLRN